jgi:hypothetical protein
MFVIVRSGLKSEVLVWAAVRRGRMVRRRVSVLVVACMMS